MHIRRRCARPAQGQARLPNWNAEAWWLRIFDGTPKDEKTIDLGGRHVASRFAARLVYHQNIVLSFLRVLLPGGVWCTPSGDITSGSIGGSTAFELQARVVLTASVLRTAPHPSRDSPWQL